MPKKLNFLFLLIFLISLAQAENLAKSQKTNVENEEKLPIEELQEFAEIFTHIKTTFVNEISDKDLLKYAVRGMLSNLDPHSDYLDKEEYEYLQENAAGNYFGLGMELTLVEGNLMIVTTLDSSPAFNAGLATGDYISYIGKKRIKNMSMGDIVKILSKNPKSSKTFTIVRKSQKPFKVVLQPNLIPIKSVKYKLLDKNFGYLRISQFQENTGTDVQKGLADLERQNKSKLLGLVLDLRNNPGGTLQAGVDVANSFLAEGLIVYTQGRTADAEMSFSATSENTNLDTYLVVLINSGTASSAEIVAGAIQDRRRGIILGTPSFGKGSVQEVVSLPNGKGLKLTTALYYTPNGRSIQAQGIIPDLILNKARIIEDKSEFNSVHEINLSGHLPNKQTQKLQAKLQENYDLKKDFILFEALNILKGLTLFEVAP